MTRQFDDEYKKALIGTVIKLFKHFLEVELITITQLTKLIQEHTHTFWCFFIRTCTKKEDELKTAQVRFAKVSNILKELECGLCHNALAALHMYANFLGSAPREVIGKYPLSVLAIRKLAGEFSDLINKFEKIHSSSTLKNRKKEGS